MFSSQDVPSRRSPHGRAQAWESAVWQTKDYKWGWCLETSLPGLVSPSRLEPMNPGSLQGEKRGQRCDQGPGRRNLQKPHQPPVQTHIYVLSCWMKSCHVYLSCLLSITRSPMKDLWSFESELELPVFLLPLVCHTVLVKLFSPDEPLPSWWYNEILPALKTMTLWTCTWTQ